jgi:hypothetical protein
MADTRGMATNVTASRFSVILPAADVTNAKQPDNKEIVGNLDLMFCVDGRIESAVTVRLFMGRSSDAQTVIACVWLRSRDGKRWLSGYGRASGYGYCKRSGAIDAALDSAKVEVGPHGFHGAGMSAAKEALREVARALGWSDDLPCQWAGHE